MTDSDDLLPALLASFAGTLVERLGIELVVAEPERVVARMPVAGNTQPHGLLHGGATAALAETVGSVAATIHAGTGRTAVGTELSATHHRSAREGHVTATATPLHLGRRTATYDVAVLDDDGRRVCTARLSCMILGEPGGPAQS
ncbi:uncharacterized protein (TIGR00369 family) [Georgenia soli]|uniref:Uncharacterized protein (TIGR00369 family) n=1 Tax=Georgenia soli TaxID=638953 RepID=A0A2A9EGH3_9MICO|nr:hotdog fold thioesterase [Georgenia soli]PFG38167.1 uncharacterized protein (TIGR00369 family) [Georgenia soli]